MNQNKQASSASKSKRYSKAHKEPWLLVTSLKKSSKLALIAKTGKYNRIGSYWEKTGKNEIDIVAINDREKEIFIAEVKTNKRRANVNQIQLRAIKLLEQYKDYEPKFSILDLSDAEQYF